MSFPRETDIATGFSINPSELLALDLLSIEVLEGGLETRYKNLYEIPSTHAADYYSKGEIQGRYSNHARSSCTCGAPLSC